jgi:hypothetical protein
VAIAYVAARAFPWVSIMPATSAKRILFLNILPHKSSNKGQIFAYSVETGQTVRRSVALLNQSPECPAFDESAGAATRQRRGPIYRKATPIPLPVRHITLHVRFDCSLGMNRGKRSEIYSGS